MACSIYQSPNPYPRIHFSPEHFGSFLHLECTAYTDYLDLTSLQYSFTQLSPLTNCRFHGKLDSFSLKIPFNNYPLLQLDFVQFQPVIITEYQAEQSLTDLSFFYLKFQSDGSYYFAPSPEAAPFELDLFFHPSRDTALIYADWCQEHGFEKREEELRAYQVSSSPYFLPSSIQRESVCNSGTI